MKLIIGLGNPGKQYEKTRHNIGFLAVDFLVERLNFKFNLKEKFKAEICETRLNNEKIIIVKPQTFMNNSGDAVQLLQSFYKVSPKNIIVVYDELDLPFEKIRVRKEGSSAGHKGIQSIIQKLGTDKFYRIRIGIKNDKAEKMPARFDSGKARRADRFVLSRFSILEKIKLKNILKRAVEEIENIVK